MEGFALFWVEGRGGVFAKSTHSYSPFGCGGSICAALTSIFPRNLGKGGPASVGSMLFMLWFASGDCESGRLWPAAKAAGVNCRACDWVPCVPRGGEAACPEVQGCRITPRLENWLVHIYGRTTLGRQSAVSLVTCVSHVVHFQASVYVDICLVLPHIDFSASVTFQLLCPETALSSRSPAQFHSSCGCVHTLLGLHINLLFTVYLCFFSVSQVIPN